MTAMFNPPELKNKSPLRDKCPIGGDGSEQFGATPSSLPILRMVRSFGRFRTWAPRRPLPVTPSAAQWMTDRRADAAAAESEGGLNFPLRR